MVWRKLHEYLKIKLDFRVRKMTRAASQAGDAESSRTPPGLNSSVQKSMNDHGVRYYVVLVPHWEWISYSVFYISCEVVSREVETQWNTKTILQIWASIRDWILLVCFSWRYEATEVPRVNFVMREALFEIYTWIPCRFIPSWETNK